MRKESIRANPFDGVVLANEPLDNLPRTLRDQGHSVLELRPEAAGIYRLLVRKGARD